MNGRESKKRDGSKGKDIAGNWKKWAKDRGLMKWFQRDNLIVLVLAGILLVIIALPTKEGTEDKLENIISGTERAPREEADAGEETEQSGGEAAEDKDREYARYLEERLTETLSKTAGVGKVKVMITLKSSSELVVEKEQPVSRSTTNENDSQGGSRIISQMESEENTVYRTDGSFSEPYVVKTLPPQIEGVVVVAEGAGNGSVNRTIVEIVQALFDVEAHKVRVVGMGR